MKYTTETLTDKVFAQVTKQLDKVLNKRYTLRNFGDWNVQICIPCTEFQHWNDGGVMDVWAKAMTAFGQQDYDRCKYSYFNQLFFTSYLKGECQSGFSTYKLPKNDTLDTFRNEVLTVKEVVESLGYKVEDYCPAHKYLYANWEEQAKGFGRGDYIEMVIKSKELDEWRDMMYDGYSRSDACRLEHEMERMAEIRFEDMVMGTHNI